MTKEEAQKLKPFDRVIYNPGYKKEPGIVKEVTETGVRVVFSITSGSAPLCEFKDIEEYE